MELKKLITPIGLIALIVATRLLPHPANVASVAAVALTSGLYLNGRRRWLIPLAGLFISDLFLGFYRWEIMLTVYLSHLAVFFIGTKLRQQRALPNIIIASLAGSLIFFITTNLAVWFFGSWYTKDLAGLSLAYWLALPFFRNSLLGDLVYCLSLTGVAEAALYIKLAAKQKSWRLG